MSRDLGRDVPDLVKLYARKLWADFSYPILGRPKFSGQLFLKRIWDSRSLLEFFWFGSEAQLNGIVIHAKCHVMVGLHAFIESSRSDINLS